MRDSPTSRILPLLLGVVWTFSGLLGCDTATDPVEYEEFVKAEGEGEVGMWVHSGLYNRTYYLHTPPDLDDGADHPLLILLHGAGGTGEGFHNALNADDATDEAGYVTVYPDGLEGSWTVGCINEICTFAEALRANDVVFLQTLARHLAEHLPVDTTRVYVAGVSQGGSLAHLYGCTADLTPGGIAGVASLAYKEIETGCEPSGDFPVVVTHGTLDFFAYYQGYGLEAPLQSVLETMEMWAGRMGCNPVPSSVELPDLVSDFTTVTRFDFEGCAAGSQVVHFRVNGGGHTWPGDTGPWGRLLGSHSRDIDMTRELLAIFDSSG